MKLSDHERDHFDRLLEQVLDELPAELQEKFEEIPLVAEDHPPRSVLRELGLARGEYLCGLHTGVPVTERSVWHSGTLPTVITIYREGILRATRQGGPAGDRALCRQIRRTVLHELGHHFGFGEVDLRRYGY